MLQKIKTAMEGRKSWAERHFETLLVVAALVAMAIALTIGLHQSVWFDEAYSILLSRESIDQLLYLTSIDTHPPIYYLLLKTWAALFGYGETALRSLSVVSMGGALVVAGLLLRRMFSARVALVALPFVVFAPMLLRYGFEIRAYAVASLIGIAATYVLVVALHAKRRNQWLLYTLYAVLVAIGTLTLYYLAFLWLAHAVWLIWQARREKKPIFKASWFAALLGAALLFAPWLPIFVTQLGGDALAPVTTALTLENIAGIVSFMLVYEPAWQVGAFVSLLVVVAAVGIGLFAQRAWRLAKQPQRSFMVLLLLYVAVPILVLALVGLVRPLYLERYLSHVGIAGYMLIGVVVAVVILNKPRLKAVCAGAGILAVLLVGVLHVAEWGNYNFQRTLRPMVKQAAIELADCSPDQTILAADPYVAIELTYYLPQCEIRFYSESAELTGGYAMLSGSPLHVSHPETELASARELIYIYYDEPELVMPDTLEAGGTTDYGKLHTALFYSKGAQ